MKQVDSSHYRARSYDIKGRFASYWHQCDEILKLEPRSVLEVGKGTGFVCAYLSLKGLNITTVDIDPELAPDIVGSVLEIPCADESCDVVACCQVLEHLPYDKFRPALGELARVSRRYVVLSLPDYGRAWPFCVYIPKYGAVKWLWQVPLIRPPEHKFDGEHHWEIGKRGYPLARILADIKSVKLKMLKTYRVFEFPYHRFFVLEAFPRSNEA